MDQFNTFLMPSSFLRRWSYNELIPALLYFDRVTFLMDDIEPRYISDKATYQQSDAPPVRLRSPKELAGMDPNDVVDGLLVEQHRYYWPMHDLMKEEVIVISSWDMGPLELPEHRQELQTLLSQKNELALEYQTSASRYYDYMSITPSSLSDFEKAMELRSWIKHALMQLDFPNRRGWEQVTLHPDGYVALLTALALFPELRQLSRESRVDKSGKVRHKPSESYTAMRVVGTLLRDELDSFTLEDDPEALTEILEIRRRYSSELQTFRQAMIKAAKGMQDKDTDLWHLPEEVDEYVTTVRSVFEQTRRAMSDPLRIPKLIFKKGGSLFIGGLAAFVGAAVAGPSGAMFVGTVGAGIAESIKTMTKNLGVQASKKLESSNAHVEDKSMVYLFHAQKALR